MAFLSSTQAEAAAGRTVNFAVLAKLSFDTGDQRYWLGHNAVEIGGEIWQGTGDLVSISNISNSPGDVMPAIKLMMSGINAELLRIAASGVDEIYKRPINIYIAFFNDAGELLDGLVSFWSGFMDSIAPAKSFGSRAITLNCEGLFTERGKAINGRLTGLDQQARHPGDKGCEFVPSFISKQVNWLG